MGGLNFSSVGAYYSGHQIDDTPEGNFPRADIACLEDMTGLALRPSRGLAPRVPRSRQSHMRRVALSQSLRGGPTHVISRSIVAPSYYLPRLGCAQGVDHHRRAAGGRVGADARRAIAERPGEAPPFL